MRRMIPQKDIDYVNQLKYVIQPNDDYTMGAIVPYSITVGTNEDYSFWLDGADGWIIGPCIGIGDPEGEYNSAWIEIDNRDDDSEVNVYSGGETVATFGEEPESGTLGLTVEGITIGKNTDDEPNIHSDNGNLVISDYTNPNANSWISFQNDGDLTIRALNLIFADLPTSDPHVANALWNDNGTLKISSGN